MRLLLASVVCLIAAVPSVAQERSAAQVYRAACATCHGPDGAGMPKSRVGFDLPLPDFSDCNFATREPDSDWFAITHDGGPARAFDRKMPAFGEALTRPEIELAISHVRTFCDEPGWPRGDMNLPRPLVTEKAFPEDEAVFTTSAADGAVVNKLIYEHRFGPRSQIELVVPFSLQKSGAGAWHRGLGDAAIAVKHVLASSLGTGSIVSVAGELVLPTGKETEGLGGGVTKIEPFLAYGQILPRNAFLHVQVGAELPLDQTKQTAGGVVTFSKEAFWRAAAGMTFEQANFGRAWSPMVELVAARELAVGERAAWDVVPQMQVTLSKRQHIMVNAGVRVPVNDRAGRGSSFMTYLLWDWFDGGFLNGWR